MHWNSLKWKVNGQSNFVSQKVDPDCLGNDLKKGRVQQSSWKLQKPLQLVIFSESVSCLSNVYIFPSIILSTLEQLNCRPIIIETNKLTFRNMKRVSWREETRQTVNRKTCLAHFCLKKLTRNNLMFSVFSRH